jgi:large subunit ribosomal protein L15
MNLSTLPKITQRPLKRVGRGYGSGKGGHTSSRGQKGQRSRGSIPLIFEGTKAKKSLLKRLPLLRGKNRLKPWKHRPDIVKLDQLTDWPPKIEVNKENLIKRGLVRVGAKRVKIIGVGKINNSLSVKVGMTESVAKRISKESGKT